ncbi:Myblike DNA-binding domain containing protein [Balamuthia mandrillaris]
MEGTLANPWHWIMEYACAKNCSTLVHLLYSLEVLSEEDISSSLSWRLLLHTMQGIVAEGKTASFGECVQFFEDIVSEEYLKEGGRYDTYQEIFSELKALAILHHVSEEKPIDLEALRLSIDEMLPEERPESHMELTAENYAKLRQEMESIYEVLRAAMTPVETKSIIKKVHSRHPLSVFQAKFKDFVTPLKEEAEPPLLDLLAEDMKSGLYLPKKQGPRIKASILRKLFTGTEQEFQGILKQTDMEVREFLVAHDLPSNITPASSGRLSLSARAKPMSEKQKEIEAELQAQVLSQSSARLRTRALENDPLRLLEESLTRKETATESASTAPAAAPSWDTHSSPSDFERPELPKQPRRSIDDTNEGEAITSQPSTVKKRRVSGGGSSGGGGSKTERLFWTDSEVENLMQGVKKYGAGNWATIRQNFTFHSRRTTVDLKDKYRNLLRAQERERQKRRTREKAQEEAEGLLADHHHTATSMDHDYHQTASSSTSSLLQEGD